MFKYYMIINNEIYNAVFADHFEAADFLDEADREGDAIVITAIEEVSVADILADEDLEWSYRVELAAMALLDNWRSFQKWTEQEAELMRLGFIS